MAVVMIWNPPYQKVGDFMALGIPELSSNGWLRYVVFFFYYSKQDQHSVVWVFAGPIWD